MQQAQYENPLVDFGVVSRAAFQDRVSAAMRVLRNAAFSSVVLLALAATLCKCAPINPSNRHFITRDPVTGEVVYFVRDPETGEPIFFEPSPDEDGGHAGDDTAVFSGDGPEVENTENENDATDADEDIPESVGGEGPGTAEVDTDSAAPAVADETPPTDQTGKVEGGQTHGQQDDKLEEQMDNQPDGGSGSAVNEDPTAPVADTDEEQDDQRNGAGNGTVGDVEANMPGAATDADTTQESKNPQMDQPTPEDLEAEAIDGPSEDDQTEEANSNPFDSPEEDTPDVTMFPSNEPIADESFEPEESAEPRADTASETAAAVPAGAPEGRTQRRVIATVLGSVAGLVALSIAALALIKCANGTPVIPRVVSESDGPVENAGLGIVEDQARLGGNDALSTVAAGEFNSSGAIVGESADGVGSVDVVGSPSGAEAPELAGAATDAVSGAASATRGMADTTDEEPQSTHSTAPIIIEGVNDSRNQPAASAPGQLPKSSVLVKEISAPVIASDTVTDSGSFAFGGSAAVLSLPELDEDDDSRGI